MLIHDCKPAWEDQFPNEEYTQCTVTLGNYENYAKMGLSDPWQTQAGWIGPAGGKGILGGSIYKKDRVG